MERQPCTPLRPRPAELLTEVEAAVPADKLEGVHQLPAAQSLTGAVSSIAARGEGQEGEQPQHRLSHSDPHWCLRAETRGVSPPPRRVQARAPPTAHQPGRPETPAPRGAEGLLPSGTLSPATS